MDFFYANSVLEAMPHLSLVWTLYGLGLVFPGFLPPWPSLFILIALDFSLDIYTLNIVATLLCIIVTASAFKYDLTMRTIGTPLRLAIYLYDALRRVVLMANMLFCSYDTRPSSSAEPEHEDTLPDDDPIVVGAFETGCNKTEHTETIDPDETLVNDIEATLKSSSAKPKATPRRNVFRAPESDGESTDGDTDFEGEFPRSHTSRPTTPILKPVSRSPVSRSPLPLSPLSLPSCRWNSKIPEKVQNAPVIHPDERCPIGQSLWAHSKQPTSRLFGNAAQWHSNQQELYPPSAGELNTGLSNASQQNSEEHAAERQTAKKQNTEQANAEQVNPVQVTAGKQVTEQQAAEPTTAVQSHVERSPANQSSIGHLPNASAFARSQTTVYGYESEVESHVRLQSSQTTCVSAPSVAQPSTTPLVASKIAAAKPPADGTPDALELSPFQDALRKAGGLQGIFEVPEGFSPLQLSKELLDDTPPPANNPVDEGTGEAGASNSQLSAPGKETAVGSAEKHLIDFDG
ncbi:hypothetical protein EVG20_g7922, partial [Dentipellis fragilis]